MRKAFSERAVQMAEVRIEQPSRVRAINRRSVEVNEGHSVLRSMSTSAKLSVRAWCSPVRSAKGSSSIVLCSIWLTRFCQGVWAKTSMQ